MRTLRVVPAGIVNDVSAGAGAGRDDASGLISFTRSRGSTSRCCTSRRGAGALAAADWNSIFDTSVRSKDSTRSPTSIRTCRAVPPRYVPATILPSFVYSVSADPSVAMPKINKTGKARMTNLLSLVRIYSIGRAKPFIRCKKSRLRSINFLQSAHQHFSHGPAVSQRGFILSPALLAGEAVADSIIPLQTQSDHVGTGKGDGRLRDQAAPERDLSHQLAGDGAKPKRPGHDGDDLRLLCPVADFVVAGCGDEETHADLVHREEGRIAGEFADDPGQLDQVGNHIRQRRGQRE